MAQVVRCVGDDHEPTTFSTWAPKALALIGRMHDTLRDRSIVLEMRRRLPSEAVDRLRADAGDAFLELRKQAARWTTDVVDGLRQADPDLPEGLGDRAADNWRSLLAIADLARGDWPRRAREAAMALSGGGDDESIRTLLLWDLRAAFDELGPRITSHGLAERLAEMEARPWPEWKRGKPITPRQIASLLRGFRIEPTTVRAGGGPAKGYKREDCEDAFSRYLPLDPLHGDNVHGTRASGGSASVTPGPDVTDGEAPETAPDGGCNVVTDREGKDLEGTELWEL